MKLFLKFFEQIIDTWLKWFSILLLIIPHTLKYFLNYLLLKLHRIQKTLDIYINDTVIAVFTTILYSKTSHNIKRVIFTLLVFHCSHFEGDWIKFALNVFLCHKSITANSSEYNTAKNSKENNAPFSKVNWFQVLKEFFLNNMVQILTFPKIILKSKESRVLEIKMKAWKKPSGACENFHKCTHCPVILWRLS